MYNRINTVQGPEQNQLLREFLGFLFPGDALVEIRPIPDRTGIRKNHRLGGFFDGSDDLLEFLPDIIENCRAASHALHYGILPRKNRESGKRANCKNGRVIWTDIDDKDTGSREKSWALVNDLPIEPSAIVTSGGGLHVYFFIDREVEKDEIEILNKGLLRRCGGDPAAWDAARILRLPLSWHLKKEPVRVVFSGMSGIIYKIETLREILKTEGEKAKRQRSIPKPIKSNHRPRPILSANVQKMMEMHPDLSGYFQNKGKQTGKKSPSDYDWVFARELKWRRVDIIDAFNALCAKIRNEGRDYDYVAEDGTERRAKTPSYIIKTVERAYASLEERPVEKKAVSRVKLGDRDSYPRVKLERYPDEYGDKFKRGKPMATIANCHMVIDALNVAIGDLIRFNEFTGQLEFQGERIADHHITELRLEMSWAYGVQFRKDDVGQMVEFISRKEGNMYHPVRDYLEKLEREGVREKAPRRDYASTFLHDFCTILPRPVPEGLSDEENKREKEQFERLISEMGRAWLVSAVKRIFNPGCKVDCSLILLGPQGIGKSTLFRLLAVRDEWFSDSAIDIRGGRDSYSKLRGKWIYEFAELSSTRNRDSTVTKSFLSSQSDTYRPAYARYEIDQKRQVVFCGSSNELEIFRDVTGDRRYYPIMLKDIKIDELRENIDHIWADAVHLYRQGDPGRLTEKDGIDFEKLLSKYQEPYKATDSWMEAIETHLLNCKNGRVKPKGNDFTLTYLLVEVLKIESPQQNRAVLMRLSGLLSGAGWTKRRKYNKDTKKSSYVWTPPKEEKEVKK